MGAFSGRGPIRGTFTYKNGDKYVGEFSMGRYSGEGTLAYANGSVEKGIWKNDLLTEKIAGDLIFEKIKKIFILNVVFVFFVLVQFILRRFSWPSPNISSKKITFKRTKKTNQKEVSKEQRRRNEERLKRGIELAKQKLDVVFVLKSLRQAFTAERLFGAESILASIFGGGSRVDDRVAEAKAKQELAVEGKLEKLEYLYEEGLITEEVYKARKISILESYK